MILLPLFLLRIYGWGLLFNTIPKIFLNSSYRNIRTTVPRSKKVMTIWSLGVAVTVVVAVLIGLQTITAVPPTFVEAKFMAQRVVEDAEIQDVNKRALYVPVSSTTLDTHIKLRDVLVRADSIRSMIDSLPTGATLMPVWPQAEVEVSESEANTLVSIWKSNFIHSEEKVSEDRVMKFHHVKIQVDNKFYVVTIKTVYEQ